MLFFGETTNVEKTFSVQLVRRSSNARWEKNQL